MVSDTLCATAGHTSTKAYAYKSIADELTITTLQTHLKERRELVMREEGMGRFNNVRSRER